MAADDPPGDHVHHERDDEQHEAGRDELGLAHAERLGEVQGDLRRDRLVAGGDEAEAEQWAEKKLSTAIVDAGEWLDSTFNLNIGIFEVAAKGTAIFLETASFVCGVVTIINQVKTCFNLQDLRSLDLRNPTSRSFRQSLVYAKNIKWFRADRLGSFENWLNFTQKGFIASFETKGLSLGTEIAEILLS